jgi:hypothetical protein
VRQERFKTPSAVLRTRSKSEHVGGVYPAPPIIPRAAVFHDLSPSCRSTRLRAERLLSRLSTCTGVALHSNRVLWLSFIVLLWPTAVGAHDLYGHLVDENGASCCSDRDCTPAQFRAKPDGVWMFVQGRWIPVPSNKIQYRTLLGDDGQTGGGHWCGWALDPTGPTGDSRAHTICAVLPPTFAAAED